jgi:hypothetical protein
MKTLKLAREYPSNNPHTHTHIYMDTYKSMCLLGKHGLKNSYSLRITPQGRLLSQFLLWTF